MDYLQVLSPIFPRRALLGPPQSVRLRVDFHGRVIFYMRSRVNVKVERGSTFTFMRDHAYVAFIYTRKATCLRT